MTDDDPTAWFEQLYTDAAGGGATVPWDRATPGASLVEWAEGRDLVGVRTLVVGCGYGRDSEFLAGLGADVVAFDVAPTAIAGALARYPRTSVDYVTADLLSPPPAWSGAFPLVVEDMNIQALREPLRSAAIAAVGGFVAPGGLLVVVEFARADDASAEPGPPWPFSRREIDAFAGRELETVRVDGLTAGAGSDVVERWRAEFRRVAS